MSEADYDSRRPSVSGARLRSYFRESDFAALQNHRPAALTRLNDFGRGKKGSILD